MTVAVLGAGFQGVCVALELASRGVDVDLYDRNEACITQAGARNEGKIHLGFVYANDPSFDTTRLLVRGALSFDRALRRWLDCDISEIGLSTLHTYAVHRDSLLAPDAVLAHFGRVRALVQELSDSGPCSYLGQDPRSISFRLDSTDGIYEPSAIAAVIHTDERAVDVAGLATLLRRRVAAEPRIRFHPHTHVTAAVRENGRITIRLTRDGHIEDRHYPQAVNCLWDGKLAIDRLMQFMPAYRSSYRLKFGIHLALREPLRSVPSTTFVVGPFGDIVCLDDRRLYLSWYPVARCGMSTALVPPDTPRELDDHAAGQMLDATLEAFAGLVLPMRALHPGMFESVSVKGGIIVASGDTDIDDPGSLLHQRTDVGIRSLDGYHSVDTGKYTLAPMYAIELADRVCGTA